MPADTQAHTHKRTHAHLIIHTLFKVQICINILCLLAEDRKTVKVTDATVMGQLARFCYYMYTQIVWFSSVRFKTVSTLLKKAHIRSAPTLRSVLSVAFEAVPMFV